MIQDSIEDALSLRGCLKPQEQHRTTTFHIHRGGEGFRMSTLHWGGVEGVPGEPEAYIIDMHPA